ncbi:GTP-binding protein [Marinifilum fragile]|uniref:CobW family GTP-binding protein n=1 Tax=Marinifilum fragile TaxID=570161 RepID=UPI002AA602C5|nr:GTP-binding protein [Marinifilum fragile]
MSKIPVTVITGFLGAGKTSLLNNLIAEYPDKKFAIIENEFGEENIDSSLVENIQSEDIFELSNGCICCNLNQELFVVLQKLVQSKHNFNHLLIETTGIADPGSILASFISDPIIKNQFELDSVICLVDAKNASSDLKKENVLSKQIAVADIILFNKLDLVNEEETESILNLIKEQNQHAKIIKSKFSNFGNHKVLDQFSYKPEKIFHHILGLETNMKDNSSENMHRIQNMLFKCEEPLDQMKIGMWLDAFLQFNHDTIYRVKGILNLAGVDNRIILQSVHTQIQATVGKVWNQDEKRESKIVIIGKDLNQAVIEKNLLDLKA